MALAPAVNQNFDVTERIPIVDIMGCKISSVTVFEALATIEIWIEQQSQRCKFVVATGFHGVWEAQKNSEFRSILNSADLFCPDGIAPVWLSRIMGEPLNGRVPGPDLLAAFINAANIKGYSSFFLGDTPETLAALTTRIAGRYPGHRIAGPLSPPFRSLTEADNEAILETIHKAKPDVLWVAFGLPKQELWISQHLKELTFRWPSPSVLRSGFSVEKSNARHAGWGVPASNGYGVSHTNHESSGIAISSRVPDSLLTRSESVRVHGFKKEIIVHTGNSRIGIGATRDYRLDSSG
jgi:N-acetylglucosaminyldiphosphoundecaprenol N-acetyl-beta-D-mannosaminyltransferase